MMDNLCCKFGKKIKFNYASMVKLSIIVTCMKAQHEYMLNGVTNILE